MYLYQESPIDSSSSSGIVPEELVPSIALKNIHFSFPARPDKQVYICYESGGIHCPVL